VARHASQPTLGIVMLDTRFPRPPGDIGNPDSFSFPVLFSRLDGATVAQVVTGEPLPQALKAAVLDEAHKLVAAGATAITTSCGFLSPLQAELQAALPVPVITSALWLLPRLRQAHGPDARIGIITYDARKLSAHHVPDDGPLSIEGLAPGCHLHNVIAEDLPDLDLKQAETDAADAARRLCERAGRLDAVVLECTNLPPYREKIAKICRLPVLDIHDAIKTFAFCR
jgi:Asp/Glu/hydantoin racemase